MAHRDRQEDITRLLSEIGDGSPDAVERLYPLVYEELRRLAQSQFSHERDDHTLQATALVHEAYIKLVDQSRVVWKNRAHFFAIASQAIRRILVDHARARLRDKRGGRETRVAIDDIMSIPDSGPSTSLVDLDLALDKLAEEDPLKSRIVELRFFGGLSTKETADALATSTRTVERNWQYARAWLYRELTGGADPP